jgi:hypothetical protein
MTSLCCYAKFKFVTLRKIAGLSNDNFYKNRMSYTVNHFETLRTRFPTWPELKAHLISEGLRIVETPDSGLVVIRYVKGTEEQALFRSVVWDTVTNLPLSVAPPKAQSGEPPLNVQLSATEDFVDGVMVNAFTNGALQLATRTSLGANNHFYSEKSFSQMFTEAIANTGMEGMNGLSDILEAARVSEGATSCFASFVLQHPEHRVVAKVDEAVVYVIQVGYVSETGAVTLCERATNWPQAFGRLQVHSYATRRFAENEAKQMLQRTAVQRGWRWQGLVFKDGNGARWRLRSTTYQALRSLRGNEAKAEDRFLRLRASKQVMEYLKHYSEDRDIFWGFEQVLRERTDMVLNLYNAVHKARTMTFKDVPPSYRPAIFLLHKLWLDELRPKGFVVRLVEAGRVIAGLRDFEQKRLMEAEPVHDFGASVAPVEAPVEVV